MTVAGHNIYRKRRTASSVGLRCHSFMGRMLALLVLTLGLNTGTAGGQIAVGVQTQWGNEADFGIGTRVIVDLKKLVKGFEMVGSVDYFFPGEAFGADMTQWEVNANLIYRTNTRGHLLTPYAGAGLNVARFKASLDVLGVTVSGYETRGGLNLLGGVLVNLGDVRPFVEGRAVAGGAKQFVASVGVRWAFLGSPGPPAGSE